MRLNTAICDDQTGTPSNVHNNYDCFLLRVSVLRFSVTGYAMPCKITIIRAPRRPLREMDLFFSLKRFDIVMNV